MTGSIHDYWPPSGYLRYRELLKVYMLYTHETVAWLLLYLGVLPVLIVFVTCFIEDSESLTICLSVGYKHKAGVVAPGLEGVGVG